MTANRKPYTPTTLTDSSIGALIEHARQTLETVCGSITPDTTQPAWNAIAAEIEQALGHVEKAQALQAKADARHKEHVGRMTWQ